MEFLARQHVISALHTLHAGRKGSRGDAPFLQGTRGRPYMRKPMLEAEVLRLLPCASAVRATRGGTFPAVAPVTMCGSASRKHMEVMRPEALFSSAQHLQLVPLFCQRRQMLSRHEVARVPVAASHATLVT